MSTPMPTRTLTDRRAIAKRARQYGHFATTEREGYVKCPRCGRQVDAHREINYAATTRSSILESWAKALDRAMLAHLDPEWEACEVA